MLTKVKKTYIASPQFRGFIKEIILENAIKTELLAK